MPTYDYKCSECDTVKEVFHGINEEPKLTCEKCGHSPLVRIISGCNFVLKGEGWPSKKHRIASQIQQANKKAERAQELNFGHLRNSQVVPNCDGVITGEQGDPEAWREAAKVAKEKGFDTESYERKAKECEDAQKFPEGAKIAQANFTKSEKKSTKKPKAPAITKEKKIKSTHSL